MKTPAPIATARTGGRKYLRRMPAISSRMPLTVASTNALPTSGSLKIRPTVNPISRPGMRIPRFHSGIWRWKCSPYQARAMISAILANSEGWKCMPPKLNQRRAPLILMPTCRFNTNTSINTATPSGTHQIFLSWR